MSHLYDAGPFDTRVVGKVLAEQARVIGSSLWLRTDERRVTFADADAIANRYANGLKALGLQHGDMIALVMRTSIDLVLLLIGASRLGVVVSPINTDYRGAFLTNALAQTMARLVAIDADLAPRLADARLPDGCLGVLVNGGGDVGTPLAHLLDHAATPPDVEVLPGDALMVCWSSGTTGRSKGVLHSHSSMLYGNWRMARTLAADEINYCCTPMYLGSPWNFSIWPSLIGGQTTAIDPAFSVSRFWDRIRHYKATRCILVGAMHVHLLEAPPHPDDRNHTLRTGSFVPVKYEHIPLYKERFGITSMPQAYGTIETLRVFEALDDGTAWEDSALGYPVEHFEVKLLDDRDLEVPVGEVGEICIRPRHANVMYSGYFNAPEDTLRTFRNLWHHVGDYARKDAKGVFYFAGRKKDYIRYKGRNMSLMEVETVAAKYPAVAEVAAYGVQSAEIESEYELGLAVTLREKGKTKPEDIARYINDNAPYFFVPRYIAFVDSLPRNGHGRVEKHRLPEVIGSTAWDRDKAGFQVTR